MNESQLSLIKERLMASREHAADKHDADVMPAWEQRRSPDLPFAQGYGSEPLQPEQIEAVQALRHRSTHSASGALPEATAVDPAASASSALEPYLRRLYDEATQINALSQQYEVAIQRFQRTVKGIDFMLVRRGESAIAIEDVCQLRDAALTEVAQDSNGRYILRAVQLDLNVEEERAYQTAADVRTRRPTKSINSEPLTYFHTLVKGPISGLEKTWQSLATLVGPEAPLTPLDIVVWGLGGLISRQAMDLVWMAMPGLWPGILVIVATAVGFGLYRLVFTQQPGIGFIARLGLVLVGLLLGGYI
jgi:hypothetical protein